MPWEEPLEAVGRAVVDEDVAEEEAEGDVDWDVEEMDCDVGREVAEDDVVGGGVIAEVVGEEEGVAEVELVEVVGGGVKPPHVQTPSVPRGI